MNDQPIEARLEIHNPAKLALAILRYASRRAMGEPADGFDGAEIRVDGSSELISFTVCDVRFDNDLGLAVLIANVRSDPPPNRFTEVAAVMLGDIESGGEEWLLAPLAVSYDYEGELEVAAAQSARQALVDQARAWARLRAQQLWDESRRD